MKLKSLLKFINHYLLITITLSFMLGIVGQFFNDYFLPFSLFILTCSIIPAIIYRHHKLCKIIGIIAISLSAGSLNLQYQSKDPPSNTIYSFVTEPQIVTLQGVLKTMPTYNGTASRLTIDTQYIFAGETNQETDCTGTIYLKIRGNLPKDIIPGDTLIVKAKLKRANGYLAPGVFYYPRFLAQKDIWITGYISSPLHIHKIAKDPSQINYFSVAQYFPEQFRYSFAQTIDKNNSNTSAIYKAILLGDRSSIPDEILESFKKCGLMHILAISGLHMAVLVSLIYILFVQILKRFPYLMLESNIYKIAAFLTIPIIIIYSSITGGHTPVIRAVLMASFVLAATTVDRKSSPLTLIALAALLILSISPHQLATVSFQLSFVAVISIVLFFRNKNIFSKEIKNRAIYVKLIKYIFLGLQVSIVATISTMPILLYHFNRISLIGPLANIIIEPLICLGALPLGFIAIISGIISPELSAPFLKIGSLFIELSVKIISFIGEQNNIDIWRSSPQPIALVIFYLAGSIFLCNYRNNIGKLLSLITLIGISILFFIPMPTDKNKVAHQMTFLDVGQGSSTLIEFKNGSNIIIDCGGWEFKTKTVGEMVVGPYLFKKRIDKIDSIFLTHGDSDHYNGAKFIIEHFDVNNLIISSSNIKNNKFYAFINWAKDNGIKVLSTKRNSVYEYGNATVRCIENFNKSGTRNLGAIYQVKLDKITALFPGDIPNVIEEKILDYDIKSNILLSPHHGSKTSNSNVFIKKVNPQFVIVSSAPNREHFPALETTKVFSNNDLQPILTAKHGTIELLIKESSIKTKMVESRDFNPLTKAAFQYGILN